MTPMPTPESMIGNRKASQKFGGDFAPVAKFTAENQTLLGIYQGRGQFKTPDGKMAVSHNFKLTALTAGIEVILNKEKVIPAPGLLVSISGSILDTNLTNEMVGKTIGVKYVGSRKTARNGSPVKVFELEVYEDAGVPA